MERIKLEIKRQPFHILVGLLLIAFLYHGLLTPMAILIAALVVMAGSVYVRKAKPKAIWRLLEHIEREDALREFPGKGLIAYLIGAFLVVVLFEKEIALASIMILALGDSFSRLVGPFGRIRHPFNNTKFVEGVIAGMVAASLGAMLFVSPSEAIVASFFAMLLEGIDLKILNLKVDDNLTIPLVAGAVIWAVRLL
ncbi:SEC59/DGK1/VTE5 family protein [Candidatus Woesearchaeota archaeon]|nr:SEC59/DGK1/VTE5 family protein [Candidatus Woesearchaeota archaeon]